jgi:hypothetical protein
MTFDDAIAAGSELAKTMASVNDSMSNVPTWYRINQVRFGGAGADDGGGGGSGPLGTIKRPDGMTLHVEGIYISANNVEQLQQELTKASEREAQRQTGSTASVGASPAKGARAGR